MTCIRFPSHVIRSCSLKPLQVCVPSGVKQTIIAQFFSILMTGSAINIDFCFFSLRATQLIVPRWPVIKCLLIYFSGQDGGNRHYFSFFYTSINDLSTQVYHHSLLNGMESDCKKIQLSVLKLREFVWLFVVRRCNDA